MKPNRAAYFPIGLVLGTATGALLGNAALGALLGMLTGVISSTSACGRNGSAQK